MRDTRKQNKDYHTHGWLTKNSKSPEKVSTYPVVSVVIVVQCLACCLSNKKEAVGLVPEAVVTDA